MAAVLKLVPVEEHRIKMMRKAGRLSGEARAYAASLVKPGITTREIDKALYRFIRSHGGYPNFYHLYGFKGSACMSINDEIIHGVPGNRRLQEGDIISIDTGACVGDYHLDKNGAPHGGFHGDCAVTVGVGQISDEDRRLIEVTERSFWEGIQNAVVGNRVSDISRGVQQCVEGEGFAIVREFVGHGIGKQMHEEPQVPNYGRRGNGILMKDGLCIAIEPMITMGKDKIYLAEDRWTVHTQDHLPAAHYEHTICVRKGHADILSSFEFIEEVLREKSI
jgi:methionyl aminopeptidase